MMMGMFPTVKSEEGKKKDINNKKNAPVVILIIDHMRRFSSRKRDLRSANEFGKVSLPWNTEEKEGLWGRLPSLSMAPITEDEVRR